MKIQKAIVIGFIAFSLISTLGVFPINTHAEDSLSGNTNSGGNMDTGDDAAYAHKFMSYPENQGYRISIVDKNGNRVTNSVDVVNYVPSKLLSGGSISSGNSKNTTDYQTGFNQYKNYIGWEDRTSDGGKASNFLYSCGIKTEEFSRVTWNKTGVPTNDKGVSTYMYPKANIEASFTMAYNDTAALKNSQGLDIEYMKTPNVTGSIDPISIPLASKMQDGDFIAGGTELMNLLNTNVIDKNTNSSVGNYATILVNMRIRQFDNRGTEKSNYAYLFKFNDSSLQSLIGTKDTSGTTISQSAIISQKGYKVIIEPIYWYVPEVLTSDASLLGTNPKHGASVRHMRYVCYGTVSYIAKYTEDIIGNQQNFPQADLDKMWCGANWGGAGLGVTSLMIARDDNELKIKEPSQAGLSAKPNLANCFSLADLAYGDRYKTVGYSLHIYDNVFTNAVSTSTWDIANYPPSNFIEGPAPEPPKESEGEPYKKVNKDHIRNIVKFYAKKSADGLYYMPYKNFTRKNTVSTINVLDESNGKYKVISYFTSPTFKEPTSDTDNYDNYYGSLSKIQSGRSSAQVVMTPESSETTLYVQLVDDGSGPVVHPNGITQLTLYQNELSYPYNLGNFKPDLEELYYTFPDKSHSGSGSHSRTTHEQGPDGQDREKTETWSCSWSRHISDGSYNININNLFDYGNTTYIGNAGTFAGAEGGKVNTGDANRAASISGFNTESINPNWKFTMYRDKAKDLVTLYPNKNAGNIVNDMSLIGITTGSNYRPLQNRVAQSGSGVFTNTFNVNYQYGSLDKTLSWDSSGCSEHGDSGSYDGSQSRDISTINSLYNVSDNLATQYYLGGGTNQDGSGVPQIDTNGFSHFGMTFADEDSTSLKYRNTVSNSKFFEFYPFVKMNYQTVNTPQANVMVTGSQLRKYMAYNTVDVSVYKSNRSVPPLTIDSSQWNMHQRTLSFLSRHKISDKKSVLPGGAVYTLQGSGESERWIGVRSYQVCLPNENMVKKVSGDMQSQSDANNVLNSFVDEMPGVLSNYNIEQWVYRGYPDGSIYSTFEGSDGKNVAKVSGTDSGRNKLYNKLWSNETLYEKTYIEGSSSATVTKSTLNTDDPKYYLKANSEGVDGAKLGIIDQKQDTITWAIRSDENGNVFVTNTAGVNVSINSKQSSNDLLNKNATLRTMDNRTKAVSNFVACLERNKGADRNGQPWYNEGFESITVIEHYSAYKLGFTGSGGSVRSSALDPKLTGYLKDRADTFRYGDEDYYKMAKSGKPLSSSEIKDIMSNKIRASVFKTSTVSESNPSIEGYIGTFDGYPVTVGDMDFFLFSKLFYIPNATVMDLN
jgi:hypothetical protein